MLLSRILAMGEALRYDALPVAGAFRVSCCNLATTCCAVAEDGVAVPLGCCWRFNGVPANGLVKADVEELTKPRLDKL